MFLKLEDGGNICLFVESKMKAYNKFGSSHFSQSTYHNQIFAIPKFRQNESISGQHDLHIASQCTMQDGVTMEYRMHDEIQVVNSWDQNC